MEQLLLALKAVAEPTRLRLLVLCAHMDLTVTQLVQILGQSQPRVSRHLKLLSDAGLLERLREGGWVFYRMAQKGPVSEWARSLVDTVNHEDPSLVLDLNRLAAVRDERARLAADYFSRNAKDWDTIRSLYVDESHVENVIRDLLPSERIGELLDVGTGTGRIIEILSDRVSHAVGVDLSHDMLTVARSNLEKRGLRHCAVQHGDMYQLPFASECFDAVTIHQVLHFAENPKAVIAEAARVLRPGGWLIVVDFASHNLDFLRDEHAHFWLGFEDGEIEEWCRDAGLYNQNPIQFEGEPLTTFVWVSRRPANDIALPAA